MAALWQSLQILVAAALGACEAARLDLATSSATSAALQAAMPVIQDLYIRYGLMHTCTSGVA